MERVKQDETVRFYGFRFIFQTVPAVLRFYGSICMIDAVRFGSVRFNLKYTVTTFKYVVAGPGQSGSEVV